jgi:O-antigen ligase
MTLWLLRLANSATSTLCLIVGCSIMAYALTRSVTRSPRRFAVLLATLVVTLLILELGFGLSDSIITAVGRDSTLTGRTDLWNDLLAMAANPVLGAGYESFWLGDRLNDIWRLHPFRPNQAHNGYLEIYLNLGAVGLLLVAAVMINGFRQSYQRLSTAPEIGSFGFAMWTVLLAASVTEAAFKFALLWSTFLLMTLDAPARSIERVRRTAVRLPLTSSPLARVSALRRRS